jgi:hypothetical protein
MAQAEVLALVNYESKPGQTPQKEGLAIIDIDLESANFGKILENIPLPVGVVAHHVFYNKDVTNRRAILPHEYLQPPDILARQSFQVYTVF